MLDSQHLTVLGVLLGLGATVGLSVGFNVGGWGGLLGGILSGILTPLLLALAFRSRRTRYWLAAIADWVVERPIEEAVKDVHHLAHGLDHELEKALHRLEHASDDGHMWRPSEAAPDRFWQSHDGDLRSLGWHYHRPVEEAYRQMADLNELARRRAAPAGDGDTQGTQDPLTPSDRRRLSAAGDAVSHALERLQELDPSLSNAEAGEAGEDGPAHAAGPPEVGGYDPRRPRPGGPHPAQRSQQPR
ncbi:MAG TPA: hypothetical protein VGO14_05200 [Solirubrobacteraceae bacterium]|nr:hypothetical protein [Solirubrobacteraceae bacterium]